MKILLTGGVALVLGLAAGAYYGGDRLKDELLATRMAEPAGAGAAPSLPGTLRDEAARAGAVPGGAPATGTSGVDAAPDAGAVTASGVASGAPSPAVGAAEAVGGADASSAVAAGTNPSAAVPPASSGVGSGTDGDAEENEGAVQLARMFSVMRPEDAAAVLRELSDVEVGAILRHMQSRLSGQILAAFEPDRAAHLSRTVLRGTVGP